MQKRQDNDDERPRRRAAPEGDDGRRTRREAAALPAMAAAEAGLRQVADLTGREAQGIVFLEPADDGWVVGVEVVEDRRVPSSTDVLAIYEAKIDAYGDLTAYARKRRYARGKSDAGEMG